MSTVKKCYPKWKNGKKIPKEMKQKYDDRLQFYFAIWSLKRLGILVNEGREISNHQKI